MDYVMQETDVWCGHKNAYPDICPANLKMFGAKDECFCCLDCRSECEAT